MIKKKPTKLEQLAQEIENQGGRTDGKDPTAVEGANDDDPNPDNRYTSRLNQEFEEILRLFFRIGDGAKHEVFEALHHHSIYSRPQFVDVDVHVETIWNLTKASSPSQSKKGIGSLVLDETKVKLKLLLLLLSMKTERIYSTEAALDPSRYTKQGCYRGIPS